MSSAAVPVNLTHRIVCSSAQPKIFTLGRVTLKCNVNKQLETYMFSKDDQGTKILRQLVDEPRVVIELLNWCFIPRIEEQRATALPKVLCIQILVYKINFRKWYMYLKSKWRISLQTSGNSNYYAQ